MAIQERRGNIADLDISRLVQGEPFICLDKDSNGRFYAGIAISPNNVMRLAEFNEMLDVLTDCEEARDAAEASEEAAAESEANAKDSEDNAKDYWDAVHDAVDLVNPTVTIDFATGQLMYSGSQLLFWIDTTTGFLNWSVVTA